MNHVLDGYVMHQRGLTPSSLEGNSGGRTRTYDTRIMIPLL